MKWFHILTLVINQLAAVAEAYYDINFRERKGKTVHHTASAWFRGISWAIVGVAIHSHQYGMAILYALLLGFQYWLTFNPIYNKFKGQPWFFGSSGIFDSILPGKENRYKNLALRVLCLLVTAFIYFNIYANNFYNR